MRVFVFVQDYTDYTDLDDFPDFVFMILEDVKKIWEDISGFIFANIFPNLFKSKVNLENHLNQYNPEQRQKLAYALSPNIRSTSGVTSPKMETPAAPF